MDRDRIFSITQAPITFGPGALAETGEIARSLGGHHLLLMTDPFLEPLEPVQSVRSSLERAGLRVSSLCRRGGRTYRSIG